MKNSTQDQLKSFKSKIAVVDNNVLVDLHEIGKLGLLFEVFQGVVIPELIYKREIEDTVKEVLSIYNIGIESFSTLDGYETYHLLTNDEKYRWLSDCDKHVIVIAKEKICVCSSNDALVRKACQEFGIEYTGILGVIASAFENGIIDVDDLEYCVNEFLSDNTSCFISRKVVEEFVTENKYKITLGR